MAATCPDCRHVVTASQRYCDVCGARLVDVGQLPWWAVVLRPHRESFTAVLWRLWEYYLKLFYYIWPAVLILFVEVAALPVLWRRVPVTVYTVMTMAALPVLVNAVLYYAALRPEVRA